MHHLASALAAEGSIYQYFTSNPYKSIPSCLHKHLYSYPYIGVLNKIHGRIFPQGKYLDNYFLRKYFDSIVSEHLTEASDVYISWPVLNQSILTAKSLNIPVVLESGSCHILEVINLYHAERLNSKLQVPEPYYSKKLVNAELESYELADYINVPSDFARDSFIKQGFPPSRIFVNPYGVDLSLFTNTQPHHINTKLKFIYAGRISWKKGIHRLLHAFSKVDPSKAELLLVGDIYDHSSYLLDDLPSNISVTCSVPQASLANLFSQSDVFVSLSIQEGLSLTQLQALGCGLPVVCMHSTGGTNFVDHGHNGFILDDDNYLAQFLDLAEIFINDKHFLHQLKLNALQSTPYSLTWSSYASRYINNLNRIL